MDLDRINNFKSLNMIGEILFQNKDEKSYFQLTSSIFKGFINENPEAELLNDNTNNNTNIETLISNNKARIKEDVLKKLSELKGAKFSEEDGDYWTDIIHTNYANYNFPTDLQLEIFSKECGLNQNVNSKNGVGPGCITSVTISDMLEGAPGNRSKYYAMMNPDAVDNIFYKKNDDGSFMVDNSGKKIKKYKSVSQLRNACVKDDQLASLVSMLCLQMKYVEAVARGNGKSIKETIQALKDGTIDLPEDKNKIYLQRALANYNSVFKQYAPILIEKLEKNGYDFSTNLLNNSLFKKNIANTCASSDTQTEQFGV